MAACARKCSSAPEKYGVKRYVESLGLEVGIDIALTGYDDTPVAELIGLSSIRQPIALIASKVVELLLAEIAHQPAGDRHLTLDPLLIVRASSRNPRKG